ncbi:alpha-amylase [Phlyctema vagabunda]|uniref:alpha-amylase n=1 Tax=Phlyctema vagabunda TaxID=108571 RepID=A0ABR4PU57_9HELO
MFGQLPTMGLALLALAKITSAASADEWTGKAIYQVMTDRFAVTDGSDPDCDLFKYCGGTWQGIINKLDYIQGMGFSAIQISPVVQNFENDTDYGEAFHGYWPINNYAVNANFGSADDLKALSKALHDRDMYLMVDVVINDMATPINGPMTTKTIIDYSQFVPFNDAKYFHPYCNITNYENTTNAQECWLGADIVALPDLDTESDEVADLTHTWIKELIANYSIDGLRIDAAKHVPDAFLASFVQNAEVFTFGEIYSGVLDDVCRYQEFMDGLPNYLTYFPLIQAFTAGNMKGLAKMVGDVASDCQDIFYMGSFAENHDLPRFASLNNDLALAKNAIAFTILADGIPTMYQGQEQHATGNYSPNNRAPLWGYGYDAEAPLYNITATFNKIRSHAISIDSRYTTNTTQELYLDDSTYATRKGPEGNQVVAVYSNQGTAGGEYELVIPGAFAVGTEVTELVNCTTATANEAGNITALMAGGQPRVFYPTFNLNGSGLCGTSETATTTNSSGTTTDTSPSATSTKKSMGEHVHIQVPIVVSYVLFASALLLL